MTHGLSYRIVTNYTQRHLGWALPISQGIVNQNWLAKIGHGMLDKLLVFGTFLVLVDARMWHVGPCVH
jgi:hypothetical protein